MWLIQPQDSLAYIKLKWISELLFWPTSPSLQRCGLDTKRFSFESDQNSGLAVMKLSGTKFILFFN